jgi:hypothetical protein
MKKLFHSILYILQSPEDPKYSNLTLLVHGIGNDVSDNTSTSSHACFQYCNKNTTKFIK